MESAVCQTAVKGCKANRRISKAVVAHDDATNANTTTNGSTRAHQQHRESNGNSNLNCSDDENNDEVNNRKNNSNRRQHSKSNSNGVSNTPNKQTHSNNNNISPSYNRVVSGGGGGGGGHYKTATASLPYNKVVSNGKTILDDSTYDRIIADIKTNLPLPTPVSSTLPSTPTTTTNVLSYNQVVINSYNKPELASTTAVPNAPAAFVPIKPVEQQAIAISNNNNSKPQLGDESLGCESPARQQQQSKPKNSPVRTNGNNHNHSVITTTTMTTINNNKNSNCSAAELRRAVLSYEQVCRLNDVMNEVVSIHGRGNFPTLEVRLRDLVTVVRGKLEDDQANGGAGMKVRDIRLNGGAASHVLATESQPYNDLDLIFGVEFGSGRNYDKVKAAVLGSLFELLPEGVSRKRITACSLKEAYVSKMVKVNNDGDRWSLISLGNSRGHRNVELKFVDTMRRQFEFSVDSFQIVLDSLLQFHAQKEQKEREEEQERLRALADNAPAAASEEEEQQPSEGEETTTTTTIITTQTQRHAGEISESDYPTVVGESVYGDFHEALYHLQKKLISTRHPEEIRGGGLLKYCNLLVKMYKPAQPEYIKTLERYMCSRFFIDFPDISQQRAKLENYLWNHFVGPEEEALKYQYLMLLHSVVEESTVCLMGHERRQTLALIESLAYQVLCLQGQQRLASGHHQPAAPAYVYANGYYYAPVIPTACYCTCTNSWMACSS